MHSRGTRSTVELFIIITVLFPMYKRHARGHGPGLCLELHESTANYT